MHLVAWLPFLLIITDNRIMQSICTYVKISFNTT